MARRPATPAILKGAILIAAPPWGRRSSHDLCEAAAPPASSLSPPHASSTTLRPPALSSRVTRPRRATTLVASPDPSSPSSSCSCSRSRNPSARPLRPPRKAGTSLPPLPLPHSLTHRSTPRSSPLLLPKNNDRLRIPPIPLTAIRPNRAETSSYAPLAPLRFHETSGRRGHGCIYRRSPIFAGSGPTNASDSPPRPPPSSSSPLPSTNSRGFSHFLLLLLLLFDSLPFFLSSPFVDESLAARLKEKKQRSTALIKIPRNILSSSFPSIVSTLELSRHLYPLPTPSSRYSVFRIRSNDIPKLKQRHARFV